MTLLNKAILPVRALALATILVPDPVKLPLSRTTAKLFKANHHQSATVALAFGHMTRLDARPKWTRSIAASAITSDGVRVFLNDGSRLVALSSSFSRKIWQSAEGLSGPFTLSAIASKEQEAGVLGYLAHALMENRNGTIVSIQTT